MTNNVHKEQATRMTRNATIRALASEFIEDFPKTVVCSSIAVGVVTCSKDDAFTNQIHAELKPILERMNKELSEFAKSRGFSYSGASAAELGYAGFHNDEKRAEFENEVLPIIVMESLRGESGSLLA